MPSKPFEQAQADYDTAVAALLSKLAQHPIVLEFQAAESRLKQAKSLYDMETEMKTMAQEAALYQKIDKYQAYQETMTRVKEIEAQLNQTPLIIDYRRKLVAANELLQHLLQTIETQINEELYREH
ncbi:MAG: YlbF family regulator [Streptococcaceae bacterium]|jgi:cell fate (sporulation/competence/biofilm development) regulator YmcA (YheA/YmcA/DUF963 family)|nr:YlbF family regulator [Streptococcaceae bacterium]